MYNKEEMLIFPKGLRFPKEEELPNNSDKNAILDKFKNATIFQGFVLFDSGNDKYKYYVEMNVNAPGIWGVFLELCKSLLNGNSAPILGHKDQEKDELFYGPEIDLNRILEIFSEYQFELTNDGFIQFGIISQGEDAIEEVFVNLSKHFSIWTNNATLLREKLSALGIKEYEKLSFIDEYPRTTLRIYEGCTRDHIEVLEKLKAKFAE